MVAQLSEERPPSPRYPSAAEVGSGRPPLGRLCLKGCRVTPEVNQRQGKFCIKLLLPEENSSEIYLKCDGESAYARFLAAARLAARSSHSPSTRHSDVSSAIYSFSRSCRRRRRALAAGHDEVTFSVVQQHCRVV